jgi:hypothetical protein
MGRGGELAHVRADLGHDDLGGALVDSGDGIQQRHLLSEWATGCWIRADSTAMASSRYSMWARI